MLSLQRTLTLGYVAQHPTRMALVVASIALGVATLVATRTLNAGLNQAAKSSINPFAAMADLMVSNGQTGVPRDLAEKLNEAQIPGLASVRPLIVGRAVLCDLPARSVMVLGVNANGSDDGLAEDNNPWGLHVSVDASEFYNDPTRLLDFLKARPVFLGAKLAKEMESLPDRGRLFSLRRAAGKEQLVRRVGVVRIKGSGNVLEENALFMDVDTAAPLVYPQRPDYVTQLNLKIQPNADAAQVRSAVDAFLSKTGAAATVQTVDENERMVSDVTASLELGFSIGGVCALVVGLFLVYNAMAVSVEERRHDIGVLRSMGATRLQIESLFIGEAVVLGLLGSFLGLPLGYGLAWIFIGPLRQAVSEALLPLGTTSVAIEPGTLGLAVAAGVAVAVLASLIPAVYAALEQPADAVRRVPRFWTAPLILAQCLVVVGQIFIGRSFAVFHAYVPTQVRSFGPIVFFMLAALLATPLLTALAGRICQPLFRRVMGLGARLAADNLVRSPVRTGIVVAAIAATGALIINTAGFIHSSQSAVNDWIEESVAADLYVTAGSGINKAGLAFPMDESVGVELAKRSDVEAALPVRFHYLNYQGQFINMIAVDARAFHGADQGRAMARNLGRFPRLIEKGTVLASENFAALHHVGFGDHITVPGRSSRDLELEIIGTVVDYSYPKGTLIVDRGWFSEEFGDDQVDVFDVYLKQGADAAAVKAELEMPGGYARKQSVFVGTRDELHAAVSDQMARLYSLAYAQQFIVGVVSLLGVVSALFISVLQRRRELGLLRAVGATQSQVLWSVLAEAALMGAVGAAIGAAAGLALEWYMLRVLLFDEAGFMFPVRVPWLTGGAVLALCVVLSTFAGLWPAWHTTRMRIPEAIAYE
jgi:putative ABC transport system permease protein